MAAVMNKCDFMDACVKHESMDTLAILRSCTHHVSSKFRDPRLNFVTPGILDRVDSHRAAAVAIHIRNKSVATVNIQ